MNSSQTASWTSTRSALITDLASAPEAADEEAPDRPVEVRRTVDDHASTATELEHDLLHARALLRPPADRWAVREPAVDRGLVPRSTAVPSTSWVSARGVNAVSYEPTLRSV
jgi:hypothetical protein